MLIRKPLLKSSEVAKLFSIDASTVSLWVKKGVLHPAKTPGRNFRFYREDIEKLRDARKRAAQDYSERRKEERFPVNYEVDLIIGRNGEQANCPGTVRDISNSGIGLKINNPNRLKNLTAGATGARVTVRELPRNLFKHSLKGTIKHATSDKEGIALGAEFASDGNLEQ